MGLRPPLRRAIRRTSRQALPRGRIWSRVCAGRHGGPTGFETPCSWPPAPPLYILTCPSLTCLGAQDAARSFAGAASCVSVFGNSNTPCSNRPVRERQGAPFPLLKGEIIADFLIAPSPPLEPWWEIPPWHGKGNYGQFSNRRVNPSENTVGRLFFET